MDRKTFKSHLNFEVVSELFFDLAEERYPSSEKIKQYASKIIDPLTVDPIEKTTFKISLLNVIRNMIKEVSPGQLYRSMQHRDDFYLAVIEALEDLEEELEELEDEAYANEEENEKE